MESERQQQIEVIKMASEYMDKLIPSMETVVSEIKGERQDDTIDFLMQITDGFNFMLEAYNVTSGLINEEESLINGDVLEETVGKLSSSFGRSDYEAVANSYEEFVIPFLKVFNARAKEIANV